MIKPLFFCFTLLLSSALVFLVQFMCAKMVLPLLGGTPAVWNTCLVFFQAGLLVGYAYAHLGPRLGRTHALVHLALLGLAFWFLPIDLRPASNPPEQPVFWLLGLLTVGVGLPFVLLSSSGPLVQHWFAQSPRSGNPYFLYAASNVGSLLGLLSYPLVIEPNLTLAEQNQLWTWSFAALAVLLVGCAGWATFPTCHLATEGAGTLETCPTWQGNWQIRLRWVLLALVPSSLMLSVTSYLTTDIAAIPLLWVVPMGLYLLSFVLVFARHPRGLQAWLARWLPGAIVVVLMVQIAEGNEPIWLIVAIHLLAFFWAALVCHGQLAASKPPASHLTEFYLWLAVGGVLGGLVNSLVAPVVFSSLVEYPLMLILAAWLTPRDRDIRAGLSGKLVGPRGVLDFVLPFILGAFTMGLVLTVGQKTTLGRLGVGLVFGPPVLLCLLWTEKPFRFALALAGLMLAGSYYDGVHGKLAFRERSFFGVHRVTETGGFRNLVHGNTVHGRQSLDPEHQREPLTYYYRSGPIGQVFTRMKAARDPRLERVGLVGMGSGALASYSEPGQHWTFFEIDPAVQHIARDSGLFTFLQDAPGQVDDVLGDARLTLQQTPDRFGVLVIDAFASDSIPLHLLTREAVDVYRSRLTAHGILAFHISHRYLDIEPILANHAAELGWTCLIKNDSVNPDPKDRDHRLGKFSSIWIVMAEHGSDLSFLLPPPISGWFPARPKANLRAWTDDFSNIVQILKNREN